MSNLVPVASLDSVYQFEVTDFVEGGAGGIDNVPHQQLLNRIEYVRNNLDNLPVPAINPWDFEHTYQPGDLCFAASKRIRRAKTVTLGDDPDTASADWEDYLETANVATAVSATTAAEATHAASASAADYATYTYAVSRTLSNVLINPSLMHVLSVTSAGTLTYAIANSLTTAEAVGIVTETTNSTFTLTMSGWVDGLAGLIPGTVYYVSPDPASAGQMTSVPPTTPGHINKPIFLADSTSSGSVLANMRGFEVVDPDLNIDRGLANSNQSLVRRVARGISPTRAAGTTYTNTTESPIAVNIGLILTTTGVSICEFRVEGISVWAKTQYTTANCTFDWSTYEWTAGSVAAAPLVDAFSVIVPVGYTYQFTQNSISGGATSQASIIFWSEITQG